MSLSTIEEMEAEKEKAFIPGYGAIKTNTHFIPLLRFYWMRHAGPALSMDFPQKHRSCSRPCSLSEHSDAAHQRSSYSKKHSLVKDPGSSRCLWRASPMLSGPSIFSPGPTSPVLCQYGTQQQSFITVKVSIVIPSDTFFLGLVAQFSFTVLS